MQSRCGYCGQLLPGDANAKREYCSGAHRQAAHIRRLKTDAVLGAELRSRARHDERLAAILAQLD